MCRFSVILVAWCVLWAVSCSEPSSTFEFEGVVVAGQGGMPLSGVMVQLSGQRLTGSSLNPNFQPLGSAVTDAQGRFQLSVDKAVFQAFRLSCSHPSHFTGTFSINPDDVPFDSPYADTYPLQPLAWVRTRILNVNASQRIDVTVHAPSSGCADCCQQLRIIREGEVYDTTFTCRAYGGVAVTHSGNYRNSDGATVIIGQQLTTVAYDTVTVQIGY